MNSRHNYDDPHKKKRKTGQTRWPDHRCLPYRKKGCAWNEYIVTLCSYVAQLFLLAHEVCAVVTDLLKTVLGLIWFRRAQVM